MMTLERYLKHERLYAAALLASLVFVNSTILATSILMEADREGKSVPISRAFITEYSSALAILLLVPLILLFNRRFPLGWGKLRRNGLAHLLFSVVFSVAHIGLFVVFRNLLFGLQSQAYVYSDNLLHSFIYEYRKDAWTYLMILIVTYSYAFILSRLRGEAVPVGQGEDEAQDSKIPERLLVRKLGKEFVVRVDDVEWLEAAGNYVNLHMGERVYPLRATMASLIDSLSDRGFVRIHRSRGVNLDYVESLTPLESGDCTVSLKSGQTVNLSRRYREAFRTRFSHHSGSDRA